ncbi:MAG TPA: hypothetical protein VMB50_12415, partial [Myxococcales bacterium]|nr:hypothetical protein [Myxococcales bacterium]
PTSGTELYRSSCNDMGALRVRRGPPGSLRVGPPPTHFHYLYLSTTYVPDLDRISISAAGKV